MIRRTSWGVTIRLRPTRTHLMRPALWSSRSVQWLRPRIRATSSNVSNGSIPTPLDCGIGLTTAVAMSVLLTCLVLLGVLDLRSAKHERYEKTTARVYEGREAG